MIKVFRLICSGFGAAGFTFLLQIILSHKLELNQFGVYAAANSTLSMIGPFVGMGIGGLFLRKVCIDEDRQKEYFSVALKSLSLNVFVAILFSQLILLNTGLNLVQVLCMSSYYLPVAFQFLVISEAQSKGDFFKVSIAQTINPFLRLIFAMLLFLVIPSLTNTVIVLCIANCISFMLLLYYIKNKKKLNDLFLKQPKQFFLNFYRESFLYSLNGSINVVQIQFSIVMAMYLFGSSSAGLYSSAIILLTAFYILPNTVFGTYLLPNYHKLDNATLRITSLRHALWAFLSGLVFCVLIFISSDSIIKLLYPNNFGGSAILLNILAISLPFRFYSTAIGAALLNEKCLRYKVAASFFSLFIQIILMFFFQQIGKESISISFVLSEILTSGLYMLIFTRYFRK